VNNLYFVTVGGIGFPAKVVPKVNKFKSGNEIQALLHRTILKSFVYKAFSASTILTEKTSSLCHRVRVQVDGQTFFDGDCVAVFVGKQEYLGKAFLACPGIRPDDPFFCVSVLKYTNNMQALKDILAISSGKTGGIKNFVSTTGNKFEIETDKLMDFFGDGEILDRDIVFTGERIPECINILVP